jgi:hypothetical protein
MVDESDDITDRFPVPARGVPIICSLNFDVDLPIPLVYFGRSTRETGRHIPESPEPVRGGDSSSRRTSNNPLNSIIRKWETQFAIQGGVMESSDYVATKGRTDDRYYHADEWLDDGEEEEVDSGEYIGEVYLDAFRVVIPEEDDEGADDQEEGESDGTDQEEEGDLEDVGGNWQLLLKRLDSGKQSVIKDLVVDLETFQAFPGHTKQKKQKNLRDSVARLRRLLPKINQVQSQWQAAVWNVVIATNEGMTMSAFMELWNDVAPTKQKEEILVERNDTVTRLKDLIVEVVASHRRQEALVRQKHDQAFNLLGKLWDLWVQEEECMGRNKPDLLAARSASKTEKRFAAIVSELIPEVPVEVVPLLLRIALFGTKKSASQQKKTTAMPEGSEDEPQEEGGGAPTEGPVVVSLPMIIFIYRKNELLKCKLSEVKSLSSQVIQITDKEWDAGGSSDGGLPEFGSFESLFESYQQKYVRKQDRVILPCSLDAWKYFAIRNPNNPSEYVTLYDLAQKASAVLHFAFTDKSGAPVFLPQIATIRAAEIEKRKKQNDLKEERKRKRDALEAKAREMQMKNPPFNDSFLSIPEFSKEMFAITKEEVMDLDPNDNTSQKAPIIAET